jgi:hypothetical protein
VIANKGVAELGTHTELMALGGICKLYYYSHIYSMYVPYVQYTIDMYSCLVLLTCSYNEVSVAIALPQPMHKLLQHIAHVPCAYYLLLEANMQIASSTSMCSCLLALQYRASIHV